LHEAGAVAGVELRDDQVEWSDSKCSSPYFVLSTPFFHTAAAAAAGVVAGVGLQGAQVK